MHTPEKVAGKAVTTDILATFIKCENFLDSHSITCPQGCFATENFLPWLESGTNGNDAALRATHTLTVIRWFALHLHYHKQAQKHYRYTTTQ